MEVPVDRQAFELVCDDIFVAPREARWLSREKGINELFERAAKRVPGEGKTKAQATAVRLSKEWSAVLEVHEVPSSLVKEVRGTPMAAKEIDLLSGSQKPRRALHKLQLDAPVTSAPEEVQLSMPIKRLSIVGGLTLERTEALQQFLQQVRPKELDLHEANPALVRALLKRLSTEPKGEHVFKVLKPISCWCALFLGKVYSFMLQKLDLRGFEVTADDYDLIMRLGHFRRIKFLDLRGHAISGEIAHLLAHLTLVSLGVTVQLIFLAAIGWWHY
ncbi:uncharacterized protein ACA1_085280 [Acanthamoeba castellanii str. Neff]|uniref:Uncharacterized protein n=1 Tax=Acanthamoeba castellanii (strain ATCC 30010 / Neff) TaxID=1257118 RepID=L8HJD4_ACACF|nr:uncharacterized protein ACA1_085280 [Acanthamoeba castellanii str. Neff]ELR25699.1 hypothetical protein ACA1_085280 [Acanthamoeba castellanii str. Neff]